MDEERIRELQEEDARDMMLAPMHDWMSDNHTDLEIEFLETLPPEDVPLDDDLPDFMMEMENEFYDFCKQKWEEEND